MGDDAAAAPSDAGTASTANQRSSVDSSIISVTADFSMQNVLLQVCSQTSCYTGCHATCRMRMAVLCWQPFRSAVLVIEQVLETFLGVVASTSRAF